MWYEPLDIYSKIDVGCSQVLYISILKKYGYDERYLGAFWPWTFKINKYKKDSLTLHYFKMIKCVNQEKSQLFYNIRLENTMFPHLEDMKNNIFNQIEKKHFVIAETDAFYTPYLPNYIYQNRHGIHATLPVYYDKNKQTVTCFSANPAVKVEVAYQEFLNMIGHSERLWCSTVFPPDGQKKTNPDLVYQYFIRQVKRAAEFYNKPVLIQDETIGYTNDFENLLCDIMKNKNETDQIYELTSLLSGDTATYIDRNGLMLIEFLEMHETKIRISEYENAIELVREQSHLWKLVFTILNFALERKRIHDSILRSIQIIKKINQYNERLFHIFLT